MFCYRKITPGRGAHCNREHFSTPKTVSSPHHCSPTTMTSSCCCSPPMHRPTDLEQYCPTRWQTDPPTGETVLLFEPIAPLCLEVPDSDRTPLFATRQRSTCHHFCSDQVSSVFTWSSFYIVVRPQTALVSTITRQACTAYGFSTPSTMGTTTQRIWLLDSVQAWKETCKRRHLQPFTVIHDTDFDTDFDITDFDITTGETVLLFECLSVAPLTVTDIRRGTDRDPVLSKIRTYTLQGWPSSLTEGELQPYWRRRDEISVSDHILLWGSRVIVPPKARERVLEVLHSTHPGVSRMKSLARSYVWWPSMDSDIESRVKNCQLCQQNLNAPAKAPLHPWEWPERAWSRVHVDYAGPMDGLMFLIVVDAYSKWMEVVPVKSATSQATIEKLRTIFVTHGLPEMLVSDNGSVFASAEFQEFTSRNAIRHVFVSPYHPSSNGLAERVVQSFKSALRKTSEGSIETRIAKFLFHQRLTPHTSTGNSPAELLMGRRPRSLLDVVRPCRLVRKLWFSFCQFQSTVSQQERLFQSVDPYPTPFDCPIVRRHIDHIRCRPDRQCHVQPSDFPRVWLSWRCVWWFDFAAHFVDPARRPTEIRNRQTGINAFGRQYSTPLSPQGLISVLSRQFIILHSRAISVGRRFTTVSTADMVIWWDWAFSLCSRQRCPSWSSKYCTTIALQRPWHFERRATTGEYSLKTVRSLISEPVWSADTWTTVPFAVRLQYCDEFARNNYCV